MTATAAIRRIGIYANSPEEISNRLFAGAHSYMKEVRGFLASDYCPRENIGSDSVRPPPWKGLVDGVIICTGRDAGKSDKDMADWVLSGGVPAVAVGADWNDSRIPRFFVSSSALAELAAQHLVECDCRSFLYVGFAASAGSPDRGRALREALARSGHELVEYAAAAKCVGRSDDLAQLKLEKGLLTKLRKMKQPLGIWALNDNYAAAICLLCRELDLDIPKKAKVLGVGDVAFARTHRPTLSSIRTPGEEVGRLAMRALHRMLDGRRVNRLPVQVPAVEVVGRSSTVGRSSIQVGLADAQYYIARHACTGLTVEHLAQRMDISRRSFELRFQSFVGHSPREEIQRVRLERAQDLLRHSLFSVGRIGAMVGFEETAAFSKFFRNQTGISPREFRGNPVQNPKRNR